MQGYKLEEIGKEIDACTELYPNFNKAVALLEAVYKCCNQYGKHAKEGLELKFAPDEVRSLFLQGKPLSSPAELLENADLQDILRRLDQCFSAFQGELAGRVQLLAEYLPARDQLTAMLTDSEQLKSFLLAAAREMEIEDDFATLLTYFAFSAPASFKAAAVQQTLDTSLWGEGVCPLCGAAPHFGFIHGPEGVRELECWLCRTRWRYPRLQCPFCANMEQQSLGFFKLNDNPVCRIHFCEKCFKYIKILDLRELARSDAFLPVHNLATLDYDVAACTEGYQAGSGLQWANKKEILSLTN